MLNVYGSFAPEVGTLIQNRNIRYVIMRYDIMTPDETAAAQERLAAFMAESDALQYEGSYNDIQVFRVAQ